MTLRAPFYLGRMARSCLLVVTIGQAGFAAAQNAPDNSPSIDLSPMLDAIGSALEPTDAVPQAVVTIPQLERAVIVADVEPAPMTTLLPMQSTEVGRILRISGETGAASLFVDLPAGMDITAFILSYRVSVDVLPERSQLQITVNGTESDPVVPVSSDGFQKVALPASLLVAGRNKIDVSITQAHRIYCGPEASFQTWTEFDLNASGVELAQDNVALTETWFKTALLAQVVGGTGVPIRGADALTPAALAEIASRIAGNADAQGGFLRMDNGYGPAPAMRDLARISVLPGGPAGVAFRQGSDGAIVLMIVPESDGGLPATLENALPRPAPFADIPMLNPGAKTLLADLGLTEMTGASHFMRHDLPFRLADDWLVLASQRATLTLLYSFAASLPEGAILLVKINDTTLQMLPLDRNGGKEQPPLAITFPARLLHPGANRLTFEATVPGDPADLPCETSSGAFLTILGQSDLTVPATPRMQIVGMGPALLGLTHAEIVPTTARATKQDLAALATELALRSQMQPFVVQGGRADASLSVVSLQTADQIPLDILGLTQRDLRNLLPDATKPLDATTDVVPVATPGASTRLVARAQRLATDISEISRPGDKGLREWLDHRTGDAVLVMPDAADPARLWLVIGPSADPVRVAQAVALARVNPDGPRGQLAILTAAGTWQDWQPAAAVPVLEEPLTLMNFRTVAGTYASWSPLYFVLLLFGLMAVSVLLGLIFVVSTRGGRKQ